MTTQLHTFIICAYKTNTYLETCIQSILNQTLESNIIISTSTPNNHINSIAQKYNIPVVINNSKPGIGSDWNFAYTLADTKYVTLAHQDDMYFEQFAERSVASLEKTARPIIAFCAGVIIKNDNFIYNDKILLIKKLMNIPFRTFPNSIFIRNFILSLGNPICCPSVTFNTHIVPNFRFDTSFCVSIDWEAWSRLSQLKGSFIYIPKELMAHRIHNESETTLQIARGTRYKEDLIMYKRYHPRFTARILASLYNHSTKSNKSG